MSGFLSGKIYGTSVDSEDIKDATIVAADIASNAITTAKINADAVTNAKIADDSLDSEHYVDGSIDTAHLAADVITGAKVADDALDSEHYTDGSIDAAHIASNAVTTAKINADAVTGAKIADDALDSEHYTDGSIDTAHIAANAIDGTLTKDALIADYSDVTITASDLIMYGDATDSNNTKRDTVQGILDLAGGGAWNVISSQTGSGVASINFTSGIDSTYDVYCFVIAGLHPANDAVDLKMLASTDGGSSYLTSGYLGAATTSFGISQGMGGVGNANDEGVSGRSYLYIPSNTSLVTMQEHTIISKNSGGNAADAHDGSLYNSASAVNAVQFKFSGGNIDSGRITLYGIAHS